MRRTDDRSEGSRRIRESASPAGNRCDRLHVVNAWCNRGAGRLGRGEQPVPIRSRECACSRRHWIRKRTDSAFLGSESTEMRGISFTPQLDLEGCWRIKDSPRRPRDVALERQQGGLHCPCLRCSRGRRRRRGDSGTRLLTAAGSGQQTHAQSDQSHRNLHEGRRRTAGHGLCPVWGHAPTMAEAMLAIEPASLDGDLKVL